MPGSYIVAGARTPIGKMSGALASLQRRRARRLRHQGRARAGRRRARGGRPRDHGPGAHGRPGPGAGPPGRGRRPASRCACPSVNVNKVCLSGLNAIYLADQMIAAGEADIVVAGGMESMTNAPYLAAGARGGFRYGNAELADAIIKRRPVVRVRRLPDGPRHRAATRPAAISRDAAGRGRGEVARAGRQRHQGRPPRRRDRPGADPAAQGRPDPRRDRRGRAPGHDDGVPRRRCARRSTRTARSPPATPRRSATAARPSS